MRTALYFVTLLASAIGPAAHALPVVLTYDTYVESKTLTTAIGAGAPVRLDGLIPDRGGSGLAQSFTFVAGATDLTMSAGWRIAPSQVRTIGVNIDLFDTGNNLVFSDIFGGVDGELALSQFAASGLTVGASYKLVLSGNALAGGRYQVDLAAGTTPLPVPPTPVVLTDPEYAFFDTLRGQKNFGRVFDYGDKLVLDGVFGETGSILNVADLRLSGGPFSGGITWLVAPGEQRTTAVNVDLFDSANTLVASDIFRGVTGGQAFSNFAVNGLIGDYRLVFTGNATQGGRYRISLGQEITAPGFIPIPTGVPEPSTWAMLISGFGAVGGLMRRRAAAAKASRMRLTYA